MPIDGSKKKKKNLNSLEPTGLTFLHYNIVFDTWNDCQTPKMTAKH